MNLKKISGYHLKYIALFSMFLDHIGVIGKAFLSKNVYFLLRAVGRLSFPLFCFILAEGFFHTKNRKKYQQRLFIFALLSEIPYDLAFHYLPILQKDKHLPAPVTQGNRCVISYTKLMRRNLQKLCCRPFTDRTALCGCNQFCPYTQSSLLS